MFQELTGDIAGPIEVPGALTVRGTVHGDIAVTGRLDLSGRCTGSLAVQLEGQAVVDALIEGQVHVRGGSLRFRGVIGTGLGARPGTDVRLAVGTVINGQSLQGDGSWAPAPTGVPIEFPVDVVELQFQSDGTWMTPHEQTTARRDDGPSGTA